MVDALRRVGFSARPSSGVTILDRGARLVVVPELELLSPEALAHVLHEAGVSYLDFLECLEERTQPGVVARAARTVPPREDDGSA